VAGDVIVGDIEVIDDEHAAASIAFTNPKSSFW